MKYAKNASIYPLNVTQGALITPEMANIIDKQGTGQAKLIKPMIDFIMRTFIKKNIRVLVGVLYDLLPFISFINDSIFEYKKSAVWISTTNDVTRGQSVADFRKIAEPTRFDDRPIQKLLLVLTITTFKEEFMRTILKPDCP